MIGYFVEIKLRDCLIFVADVPTLDCIRRPAPLGTTPLPVEWKPDGPRRWRAEYSLIVGERLVSGLDLQVYQLTARRHS